ncbi:MAG TPA: hypothetical protein VJB41_01175 [Patescibacteria group bacterium]|nr:hypothetical protein [Patescibacteria group bacterium]
MNIQKISSNNIQWFLREKDTKILDEYWMSLIEKFIQEGYVEGEFEVEIENETDSLIWKIVK